ALDPLLGGQARVAVGAREEVGDVAVAPVHERPTAATDRARHLDRLVHGALDEPAAAPAEEAQPPVGPEAAVPDPPPTEEGGPRPAIAVVRPVGLQHAADLLA